MTTRQFGIFNEHNRLPNFNINNLLNYKILADESGKALRDLARSMMIHIVKAYSIFNTQIAMRRDLKGCHQTSAIGDCEAMIMELQLISSILHIKPSGLEQLVQLILYERDLLTSWRKSSNKQSKEEARLIK